MSRPDSKPLDGWREDELEQLRSWLRLTAEQRLEWLEGAKEFAREALGAAHRRVPAKTPDPERARWPHPDYFGSSADQFTSTAIGAGSSGAVSTRKRCPSAATS